MDNSFEDLVKKTTSHPTFLKLQTIVENNGYHDHEPVSSHLTKTLERARKEIDAPFLVNPDVKKLFQEYVSSDLDGMKKSEVMLLTALLHDIGKALSYKDGNVESSLIISEPDGYTMCPGHEYRGSILVKELLQEMSVSQIVIDHISKVIRLHDSFSQWYMEPKLSWNFEKIINDMKSRGEDVHVELLFNVFVDCYDAEPFQKTKEKINELFNQPQLYTSREYFIK